MTDETMGTGKLTDLEFADDIALISDSPVALQNMTTELQGNAAKVGLWISAEKTDSWKHTSSIPDR